MNPDTEKFERLITLAQRLNEALSADIAALEAGKPQAMASLDPEVQKLTALYSREVQGFDPANLKAAPDAIRQRLTAATGKFRDTLNLHQRLLTRIRRASEGIVKAVADEVQRKQAPTVSYAPPKANYRPAQTPMIFNGVV